MSPSDRVAECRSALIIRIWHDLARIRGLRFCARPGPRSATGWQGRGEADVRAVRDRTDWRVLEHGRFRPGNATRSVVFDNVYRWRLSRDGLALSHERFGVDQAVDLFTLVDNGHGRLVTQSAHYCRDDVYDAVLTPTTDGFDLDWSIVGPSKNERLNYRYTTQPIDWAES